MEFSELRKLATRENIEITVKILPERGFSGGDELKAIKATLSLSEDDDWFWDQDYFPVSDIVDHFKGLYAERDIQRWCKSGQIQSHMVNRQWMVCPKSVLMRVNGVPDPRLGSEVPAPYAFGSRSNRTPE